MILSDAHQPCFNVLFAQKTSLPDSLGKMLVHGPAEVVCLRNLLLIATT